MRKTEARRREWRQTKHNKSKTPRRKHGARRADEIHSGDAGTPEDAGEWQVDDSRHDGRCETPRQGMPGRRWYKAGQRSCLSVTFVFFAGEKADFVSDKTSLYRLVTDKPTSRLVNAMIWFEFSRVRETEKRSGMRSGWRENAKDMWSGDGRVCNRFKQKPERHWTGCGGRGAAKEMEISV